jgi:HEAT repeats
MLFDRLIEGAFYLALGLIAFSAGLMLVVLWLHVRAARRRRRVEALASGWKTSLERTAQGLTCDVPVADEGTALEMLQTWCDVSESAGRSANAQRFSVPKTWAATARRAGLDKLARKFLERGDAPEQCVGARVLGILAEASELARLNALSSNKDGDLSFAAATALVRIDPSYADLFVARLRDRHDWIAPQVEQVVRENALLFGPAFDAAIRAASDAGMRRLLAFVPLLDREVVRTTTLYALDLPRRNAENVSVALRALRLYVEPADAARLQWLAEDPVASVRVQAVNALGMLRNPHAEATLTAHLDDPDRWVRRRAKEALARSGADPEEKLCLL